MSGLITTRPASMAVAICAADQSAHCSSPVMTSRRTHESMRVAGRIAAGLLATQQGHDLVGAHARDVLPAGGAAQPPGQPLPSAFGSFGAHDLEGAAYLDDLDLVPRAQPELGP